jgi:hypothetical protein
MFNRQKSLRIGLAVMALVLIAGLVLASNFSGLNMFAAFNSQAKEPAAKTANPAPNAENKLQQKNNALLVPLTGTKTIPGDYADLAAAITDLNVQGVGAGGVTFNVVAGNPQTAPAGGYVIGGTGSLVLTTSSAANPIVFNGANNIITAPTPQVAGNLNDGIFKLIGADWITINGFTMNENAANTVTAAATNTMTEWGVALLYVTATDGAQNNTISSNTIDLNRTYQNTFGIYSNSTHTATAVTTSVSATGAAGSNAPLTITTNNITDVNNGIVIVGPTAAADMNDGVTIGGTAPNANTLTNFGTTGTFSAYANVSGTVNGILVRNSKNANVSFNTVTSSVGGVTVGTLNGIQFPAFSIAPTGTFTQNVNNNTISLQSGLAAGAMNGINCPSGSASATSIFNANTNNFVTWGHTVAASGTITFITNASTHFTQSISSNTFTNITVNTTGSVTFISNTNTPPAGATKNVNSNSIVTAFNKTGAGGTVTFFTDNGSDPGASNTNNFNSNTISNVTLTGATAFTGISSTNGGAPTKNVNNNTVSNVTGGTGAVIGITTGFDAGPTTVTGNNVNTLSGGGAVTGMTHASGAGVRTIAKNKIYDLNGTAAGSVVLGISITSATASSNITLSNNLIGNLIAGAATSSNGIRGIDITGTALTSTFNVFYNTVYLNNTTSGAGFGSSGISTLASATATTSTLNLRNNIIVNTSVQNGAGLTVAYRRSAGTAGTLANYASTSNNNDFYAGTPSATNLIYNDGTSSAQTITAYKNGVFTAGTIAPRDSASIGENPPFLSTTGSNANFLHINPATPTQIESGAAPIAGITDDFDGNTRNATTPDIGADEFTGIALDLSAPSITYTPFLNTASTANRVLTVTITDPSGVAGGANSPRIYFKKSTDGSYVSTQCAGTSPTYTCTIDYTLVGGGSVAIGDVIQYFVVAQDTAGNVGSNPSAGFSATDVNTVSSPPTTPNSYTIVAAFPATVNVPGDYASLTNAGGLFEAMNAGVFTGNTTVNITANLAGETGTNALNQLSEEGGGAGTYTVLIRPTGAPRSITGSNATALIKLNGADRVRIDGWTAASFADNVVGGTPSLRELTISNTGAGAIIWIATNATSGANNDTIQNCILIGPGAFSGQGILAGSGTTFGANAENGRPNSNNTIQNNQISRVQNAAFIAGDGTTHDQNWSINQNDLGSATVADKLSFRGVLLSNSDNFLISQNRISGVNSSTATSSTMSGIQIAGTVSGGTIQGNNIKDIRQNNTTGWGSNGIYLTATSTASNLYISNNFVSDIASQGFNGNEPADNGYGIVVEGLGGGYNIFHNTVVMNTNQVSASGITAALLIDDSSITVGAIDLRNNILANTETLGVRYSVYDDTGAAAVYSTINYNDYFSSQNVGFKTSARVTLADWQTATGQDNNSKAVDPIFVSATDFHLQSTSTLLSAGLAGLASDDYDNDPRPASNPDIGADEIVQASGGSLAGGTYYNAYLVGSNTLGGNVTITNSLTISGQSSTGVSTLTIGCNATVTGASTTNYIIGNVAKEFCTTGSFTYPVGTVADNALFGNPPEYSPVDVTITAGTFPATLTVNGVTDTFLPGVVQLGGVSRYWTITETGALTADMTFHYLDQDINGGSESAYKVFKRESGFTTEQVPNSNNPAGNTASVSGVTNFSDWGIGAAVPTAAMVNVGGRITTANGIQGLPRVMVTITGGSLPQPVMRMTNPFGYYNFEDLQAGQTYVITVGSKQYTFSVPSRIITPDDNVTNVDFFADGIQ